MTWPPPRTRTIRLRWNGIRNRLARYGPTRLCTNVKYFVQRGRRGYSDSDVWNLHGHFSDVAIGALTQLNEQRHGYPGELDEQTWGEYLNIMIDGFEAARAISEADYIIEQPNGSYKSDDALYNEMNRTMRRGLAKFAIWYPHLWD